MGFNLNILALDTSAKAASCAVYKDKLLVCEGFLNAGLTHSVTIMPMVNDMLSRANLALQDIDVFAVSSGPGSFTGLRIGISAVKGMAFALNKPCAAVSTLEALAYNVAAFHGIIAPAMDARRSQFYTALFRGQLEAAPNQLEAAHNVDLMLTAQDEALSISKLAEKRKVSLTRISPDEALSISELAERLKAYDEQIMLVGDGAELCFQLLSDSFPDIKVTLAPSNLLHQRAASVCAVAAGMTEYLSAKDLAPIYLRLPQAERERMDKLTDNLEFK